MTSDEFREKMIPLWSFRNNEGTVDLDLELMDQMQSICIDFLSDQSMDKGKKLKAIFLMGALIGYYWELGGEKFCEAFLSVFEKDA